MGLLALNRLMSFQRQRDRRRRRSQIRAPNGLVASLANGKRSKHLDDDSPGGGKKMRYSGPDLPEDIWSHIHFLMPVRDAARAACVSQAFLHSWKCRPNFAFSKKTLGLNEDVRGENEIARDFNRKVDHILKKHSGTGLKSLEIELCASNASTHCYLNSWLQVVLTPELEQLTLLLPPKKTEYEFPSSLLCNGSGNSIQRLHLSWCAFSSTIGLDCLKKLTTLNLFDVRITGDELDCFLRNSTALEQLDLSYCDEVTCLKIPVLLKRLSCLSVSECDMLRLVECEVRNLSSFHLSGEQVELSLAESLQAKCVSLWTERSISYACVKLPAVAPNLETLYIMSSSEVVDTPMSPSTFLHLKLLSINLSGLAFSPAYDCFSLVSFLDAAPSLETFLLSVSQERMQQASVVGDPSPLRHVSGRRHSHLKNATITGFCSAKSLVELVCYILENAASLDCLTLDTTLGLPRCSSPANTLGRCFSISVGTDLIGEAYKAILAVGTYIEGKVPPGVKLNVLGPCSLCHAVEL